MVEPVTVTHERVLPARLDPAYAWLTGYDEADPERAGAVLKEREVLEADDERVVLADRVASMGLEREVRVVVELDPPDAWRATLHGADAANPDRFSYRLEDHGEGRTRLVATYEYAASTRFERAILWLISPLLARETRKMWDGYEAAMRRELARNATIPP